jgi:hypothetical protein
MINPFTMPKSPLDGIIELETIIILATEH